MQARRADRAPRTRVADERLAEVDQGPHVALPKVVVIIRLQDPVVERGEGVGRDKLCKHNVGDRRLHARRKRLVSAGRAAAHDRALVVAVEVCGARI